MTNNLKELWCIMVKTGDGRSVFFWLFGLGLLLMRSIYLEGLFIDQLKYFFFCVIIFLIFVRFRVGASRPEYHTNWWGFLNLNAFGLFVTFKEFF